MGKMKCKVCIEKKEKKKKYIYSPIRLVGLPQCLVLFRKLDHVGLANQILWQ